MTTREMLTEIRDTFGQLDPNVYSDSLLMRYINEAYISDICANFDLPELDAPLAVTTTASQAYVELAASNFLRVNEVYRIQDSYRMEPISRLNRTQLGGLFSTQVGPPEKWWLYWVTSPPLPGIGIWPTPDKAYQLQIDIRRRPNELAIGDQSDLPEPFDGAIRYFAMSRVAARLRLHDERQAYEQLAQEKAAQATGIDIYGSKMYRSVSGPSHFGSRGGGEE
jgi:hypothetical protein